MFQGYVESRDLMQVVEHPSIHSSPYSSTPKGPYDQVNTMFDSKPGHGTATLLDSHELDLAAIPKASLDPTALGSAIVEPDLSPVHLSQGPNSHAIFHGSDDPMQSTTGHPEILHSPRGHRGVLTSDIIQHSFAAVLDTPMENQSSSPPRQSSQKSNIYLGSDSPSAPHSVVKPRHASTQVLRSSPPESDQADQFSEQNSCYCEESSAVDCSTPLHYAVANAHISTVRELIFHGADVSALDKRGCAALHMGAKNQLKDGLLIIQLLVEAGASLEVRDGRNLTPLQVAAERGNDQIVKLLLALGADVNSRSMIDGEEDRS